MLVASVGMLDATQAEANHCSIIDIGVKLIVKLEVPAARLSLWILDLPVAYVSHLLLQNPVSPLHHARIVRGYSGFAQSKHGVSGVPYRGHARLHAERVFLFDAQLLELIQRTNDLRIIERVSLTAQGDDGVHH